MEKEFEGKKLLILGGNPETVPLVQVANNMGIKTIVASARHTDPAKQYAWKSADFQGLDPEPVVEIARNEGVDGVLVGVADILVPTYCKACDILGFPCYATEEIVNVFSFKDTFKKTCESYGIHGIPEFQLDSNLNLEDLVKIQYPVMIKPVDNGGGVGMTLAYNEAELKEGVEKALENSRKKRFIVERYMDCDDVAVYFTFKDGKCSLSAIFDRYTTRRQKGFSRVNTLSVYPSKHYEDYMHKFHDKFVKMFEDIGIKNGVLLIAGYYENDEIYVYDPGFRLQGEAPHLLMKAIHGFDQREMLIRFALTGSEGSIDLSTDDRADFRGKHAATLWILVKEGNIKSIKGLDEVEKLPEVVYNGQRLFVGDNVPADSIGTERQVLTRLYLVADTEKELAETIEYCINNVEVLDDNDEDMRIPLDEAAQYVRKVKNAD